MSQAGSFIKANTGVTSLSATSPITVSGSTGAVNISLTTPLVGQFGGTGIANTGLTINLAGGSSGKVLTSDSLGNATWASSLGDVTSVTGTTNVITATPTTGNVVVNISSLYVGQTSITTLGTISTGTWSGTTIGVTHGGTGLSSTTANRILYSSSTSVIAGLATANDGVLVTSNTGVPSWLANGTAGFVLTAQSGAPPAWAASAGSVTGPVSSTNLAVATWNGTGGNALLNNSAVLISASGDLSCDAPIIGGNLEISVTNSDNTNAASNAILDAHVGGESSGDPYVQFEISGTNTYVFGIDNSDSNALVISPSSSLGVSNNWRMSLGGIVTMPKQAAFYAYLTSNQTNTTGDGTVVSLNASAPYTIVTDQGSNVSVDGVFTAPTDGMYLFLANFQFNGTFTLINQITVRITTTARTVEQDFNFTAGSWSGNTGCSVSALVPMAAGSTAFVKYSAAGATKVVGLNAGDGNSYFCGYLAC